MKKYLPLGALIIVIAGGSYLLWKNRGFKEPIVIFDSKEAVLDQEKSQRNVSIETYMKRNVAGFSAEAGFPEVLGGAFQVTKFEAKSGAGTVSYEDGHNSYTADFKYTTDKKGLVSVTSFTVRK